MTALHIADTLTEAISIERGDTTLANVKAELAATFARMAVIESHAQNAFSEEAYHVAAPEQPVTSQQAGASQCSPALCTCQQFDNGSR